MLLPTTIAAACLAQRTESFTLRLDGPIAEALPLFGPVREREWSPDWTPRFVHPPRGAQREGVVFTTTTPNGLVQTWVLTEYDPAAGRVGYVVVIADFMATEIKIRLRADGDRRSIATVTYRRSALAPAANDQVNRMDAAWAAEEAPHWETAINGVLARGGRRE